MKRQNLPKIGKKLVLFTFSKGFSRPTAYTFLQKTAGPSKALIERVGARLQLPATRQFAAIQNLPSTNGSQSWR